MTLPRLLRYTPVVTSKKGVAGFGHPIPRCDASRSSFADSAASLFASPVLVTRWEARKGLPVRASGGRLTNLSSHRPRLVTGAVVFANHPAWRPFMAAQSAPAPLRAASAHPAATPTTTPERELKVGIYTASFGYWEFKGSRAQLEAEGVIPPGTEWPQGKQLLFWNQGRLRFWLARTRPEGVKGPVSVWASGDWWRLRCDIPDDIANPGGWRIQQKARELAQEIHAQTPAGRREWNERFSRYWAAHSDAAFQAFKATLLPQRKKPGRPAKTRTTNTTGAAA